MGPWDGYENWEAEWSDESLRKLKRDEERDQQEGTEGWYEDEVSLSGRAARQTER